MRPQNSVKPRKSKPCGVLSSRSPVDAPLDPTLDQRGLIRLQAQGFHESFGRFFAWCAATPTCAFRGAEPTAAAISARFDALVARLDATPLRVGKRPVTGYQLLGALSRAVYVPEYYFVGTAEALADAERGDARRLVTIRDANWRDDNFITGYYAVRALDAPALATETTDSFRAFLRDDLGRIGPHAPRMFADDVGFVAWPVRRPSPPASLRSPDAPPALIVAGRFDPATPYAGAMALRDALGNGSVVLTYEGGGHAVSGRVPCVGNAVRGWLEDPTVPLATATCPGGAF